MYKKIDSYDLKQMFKECNRDYFSVEACEEILQIEDEMSENEDGREIDIIDLCCSYTEYTKNELLSDYKYLLDDEEYTEDEEDEKIEEIIDKLNNRGIAILLNNDNILVSEF